ncbi:Aste57867_12355 [Aphanomyces stellatus]|uniref:Aste57867_12355 protein n=1 Tax=Aphanomyces stellatus TaxID=120398 RepID=A0A485KVB3_9STRA|nr:hypothetical protein As57867_012309 [Aphanomyces stellatus]VFT89207.1 Aste57867_12355 [Aphanomyces stellatus]
MELEVGPIRSGRENRTPIASIGQEPPSRGKGAKLDDDFRCEVDERGHKDVLDVEDIVREYCRIAVDGKIDLVESQERHNEPDNVDDAREVEREARKPVEQQETRGRVIAIDDPWGHHRMRCDQRHVDGHKRMIDHLGGKRNRFVALATKLHDVVGRKCVFVRDPFQKPCKGAAVSWVNASVGLVAADTACSPDAVENGSTMDSREAHVDDDDSRQRERMSNASLGGFHVAEYDDLRRQVQRTCNVFQEGKSIDK